MVTLFPPASSQPAISLILLKSPIIKSELTSISVAHIALYVSSRRLILAAAAIAGVTPKMKIVARKGIKKCMISLQSPWHVKNEPIFESDFAMSKH